MERDRECPQCGGMLIYQLEWESGDPTTGIHSGYLAFLDREKSDCTCTRTDAEIEALEYQVMVDYLDYVPD